MLENSTFNSHIVHDFLTNINREVILDYCQPTNDTWVFKNFGNSAPLLLQPITTSGASVCPFTLINRLIICA